MTTPTFEKDRINYLKNERINSQKKTFTKWVNSFLNKINLHVDDLFTDLSDGKILIRLLETISGEKIGPPARGNLRVHKIESVSRALTFLQKHVQLVGVGSEDIVDGNGMLILGLIWVIVLRFQIADISIEDDGSSEKRSAKEALLLWCQRKTKGYPGVDIQNFSTSWKNGLAFNALIHKHRPDLISYESLKASNHDYNLNNAFNVAWKHFGITKLLDAEDVNCPRPDDKSVMTYVSAFYHYFAKMKVEETGGRRIAKIVEVMMTIDVMKQDYEKMVTNLLEWINVKVMELRQDFTRTLPAVQNEMVRFKHFRTVEKPSKNTERVNIEVHLFAINTKIQANQQRRYDVPHGKLVSDVSKAWEVMEGAEHEREMALRQELLRQEHLKTLAEKFNRKANLRESWLDDMWHVLEQEETADNISTADSTLKRHEAISHDIQARENRFDLVLSMVQELKKEQYHGIQAIEKRENIILTKWTKLKTKLENRHNKLLELNNLVGVFRDIEDVKSDLQELGVPVKSTDYGKHLEDVESLIEKHLLIETELTTQSQKMKQIDMKYESLNQSNNPSRNILGQHYASLKMLFQEIQSLCNVRKMKLEQSRRFHKFSQEWEEEDMFIKEKEKEAVSKDVGKDLVSLTRLLKKHKDLQDIISKHETMFAIVCNKGQLMIDEEHYLSKNIQDKVKLLRNNFTRLVEVAGIRGERLKDAVQSLQYYSDANDAESWIKEKMVVVSSNDFGRDEQSAKSLLQRHINVHDEIETFKSDMKKLDEQSQLMNVLTGNNNHGERKENLMIDTNENSYETFLEETEVETDEEVEEIVEKETINEVVKEVKIPQAKVLYAYTGSGVSVLKGEVVYVLAKSNKDWWNVRRQTSRESGFVPANYVKEIEPRIVKKMAKEKVIVPEIIRVKKKVKKKVQVEKKRPVEMKRKMSPPSPRLAKNRNKSRRSVKRHFTAHFDRDNAAGRQLFLGNMYRKLVELSEIRDENLQYSQKYFRFCHDNEDLETWINKKETWLKNVMGDDEEYYTIKNRLEKFGKEMEVNANRLKVTSDLVEELLLSERTDTAEIQEKQNVVKKRWNDLKALMQLKVNELEEKHGANLFNTSCDQILSWIKEKEPGVSEDVQGIDLETVRKLQRKHQDFERELASVDMKFGKLGEQAKSLIQSHPGQKRQIRNKEKETKLLLASLKEKSRQRRMLLNDAYGQQGFLADSKDLLTWSSEKQKFLETRQEPKDIATVQKIIDCHKGLWEDILSYKDRFDQLVSYGKNLLEHNPKANNIREKIIKLQEEYQSLNDVWQTKKKELVEDYDVLVFIRDAERINAISASQQTYLLNSEIGNSLDEVESFIRKQNDFEKTLEAQEDKMTSLSETAANLISSGHYDAVRIKERNEYAAARREDVKKLAKERRKHLLNTRVLQQFVWNLNEFISWINEKMSVARDQCYREPANITNKILKHQTFEAEISANEPEYQRLLHDGQKFISQNHVGHEAVSEKLTKLEKLWNDLVKVSSNKTVRLNQAADQRQFYQSLEDEKLWLNEIETLLSSFDIGENLGDVKFLLRKQQDKENKIKVHLKTLEVMKIKNSQMMQEDFLDSEKMNADLMSFNERFLQVQDLANTRRTQLEDSLSFYQFVRDIEDELSTIQGHLYNVSSKELGTSYIAVQKLQRRHQAFENEVGNLQKRIDDILGNGQDLIDSVHFASDQIEEWCDRLTDAWESLLEKCDERREMLADAAESQRYFSEANEADSWMNEKAGLASSQDYGKDEKSVQKLIAKHNCLITDVASYSSVIEDLVKEAKRLIETEHFDLATIKTRQMDLEEQYLGLRTLVSVRQNKLVEASKLYEFLREVDELADWINDQIQVASSEDYGHDFEHLQEIQMKFEDFNRTVFLNSETYNRVDKFAKTLVADGHTETVTIKDEQDILRAMWRQLQDQISSRIEKLHSASEIHQFTNNLDDLLDRIQQKDHELSMDELGKDVGSVEAFQRKHQVFEHELKPMEIDVIALLNESSRLKEVYKGQTSEAIQEQEDVVVKNWDELQQKSSTKKRKLEDSLKFQLLNNSIRDLMTWCVDITHSMETEEFADDIASAESLLTRHDERKIEIEAREEMFSLIIANGQEMVQTGHYFTEEITEKLQLLLSEREKLHEVWTRCQSQCDEMYELAVFMKEAKQIETVITSQELIMASGELGTSADEVESLLRRHENLEKIILSQEEKVETLIELSSNLVNHDHFASEMIKEKMSVLCERQAKLQTLIDHRHRALEDSQKVMLFYQDIIELNSWLTEKFQTASDDSYKDPRNLESKLKKHDAFRAELTAHDEAIDDVKNRGNTLITSEYYARDDIAQRLEMLQSRWQELLHVSQIKGQKLKEARDHLKFNQEVDDIEMFIVDKESTALSNETGRDYDECLILNRKSEELLKEMQMKSKQIERLNELAEKLMSHDDIGDDEICERRRKVNVRWENLKELATKKKKELENSFEIYAFYKSCDELSDNINEKGSLATIEDHGKDVSGVDSLLRKHDELERSVIILNNSLEKLKQEGEKLKNNNCNKKHDLNLKLTDMMENFARVNELVVRRRTMLEENKLLLVFMSDYEDLLCWLQDLFQRFKLEQESRNLKEAQEDLRIHDERKRIIEAHQSQFDRCVEFGNQLVNNDHFAATKILRNVTEVQEVWSNVDQEWNERKEFLLHCCDLQRYFNDVDQLEKWIEEKECLILNDDLGNSLGAVENLLKDHAILQNSLVAYEKQVTRLTTTCKRLSNNENYDDILIKKKSIIMSEKWKGLKVSCFDKKKKLEQSKLLQRFLQDSDEIKLWMKTKLQIATDSSYQERSNLQQVIQKHKTFEAELTANKKRLENGVLQGKSMVQDGHFASVAIENRMEEMQNMWNDLNKRCEERGIKLKQVSEKRAFDWSVEDFEEWISNVEKILSTEDVGHDLNTVSILIKKHHLLEADIVAHDERVEEISRKVQDFIETNHFEKDEIQKTANKVIERFQSLSEPAVLRLTFLQRSLLLQQFLRDVEDQQRWLREKQRIASSDEVGRDLIGAESLMKKFEILENEVNVHEELIKGVQDNGEHLIDEEHYASDVIKENCTALKESWELLLRSLNIRKKTLCDCVYVQKYYRNVLDTVLLIEDKLSLVGGDDFGQCGESAEILLRSHETLRLDVNGLEVKLKELKAVSESMIEKGHFDHIAIVEQQTNLEQKYEDLKSCMETRQQRLEDSVSWHHFARETAELHDWMFDKHQLVDSEECGKDLEHVQLLLNKFEDFARDLVSSEDRVVALSDLGREMIDAGHNETEVIEQTIIELCNNWDELKDRTAMRLKSLEESRDLRSFENNVEDMKAWIQEKHGMLIYTEELEKDLTIVQKLFRKHEELERDVEALRTKLNQIEKEGKLLYERIPSATIEKLLVELADLLRGLVSAVDDRREKLTQSLKLQQFLSSNKNMSLWLSNMTSQVSSDNHEYDVTGSEEMLTRHYDLKTEMDAMFKNFETLKENGKCLISVGHYAADIINDKIQDLSACWDILLSSWQTREREIEKRKNAEHLNREVRQLEAWLMAQETELESSDVVNNLENVEDLLKKHDELERMLGAQEERFLNLILPNELSDNISSKDFRETADVIQVHETGHSLTTLVAENIPEFTELVAEKMEDKVESFEAADEISFPDNVEETKEDLSSTNDNYFDNELLDEMDLPENMHVNISERNDLGEINKKVDLGLNRNLSEDVLGGRVFGYSPVYFGVLKRKQEKDVGGEKCVAQPWRTYYTVLSDEQLEFFSDLDGYKSKWPVSKPLSLTRACCGVVESSSKHVLRVTFHDKSEYYFEAESFEDKETWVLKIQSVIKTHNGDNEGDEGKSNGYNGTSEVYVRDIGSYDPEIDDDGDYSKDSVDHVNNVPDNIPPYITTPKVIITDTNSNIDYFDDEDTKFLSENLQKESDDDVPQQSVHGSPDVPIYTQAITSPNSLICSSNTSQYDDLTEIGKQFDSGFTFEEPPPVLCSPQPGVSFTPPTVPLTPPPVPSVTSASNSLPTTLSGDFSAIPVVPSTLPPFPTTVVPDPSSPTHRDTDEDLELPLDLPLPPPPPEIDEDFPNMLDFIPPPVLDDSFNFLVEPTENIEVEISESTSNTTSSVSCHSSPAENEFTRSATNYSPRRAAPPPPPRPSISLLSDMELEILQNSQKNYGKKEEKKGLFSGIFKRKK